jgi:hypothetical protein
MVLESDPTSKTKARYPDVNARSSPATKKDDT